MKTKILFTILFFLCLTFSYSHQDVKNLTLPVSGIDKLEIDCGAGFLKVNGIKEGIGNIEVEAEIVLRGMSQSRAEDFIKRNVKLSLKKVGSKAVLISKFDNSFSSIFAFREKLINLTVKMPEVMDLNIDDGSGFITVDNINGAVVVDDGSGEMHIENITGNLDIDDGSGEINVSNVEGNLNIDDGSGEIIVSNVAGNMVVDDGSGDIDFEDIHGSISIDDNSGSIDIRDVLGDVTIIDGSGSIRVNGVEKDVIIKRDGSGSVNIANVKGRVVK